jgi:hypothetical protein
MQIRVEEVDRAHLTVVNSVVIRTPMTFKTSQIDVNTTGSQFEGVDGLPSVHAGLSISINEAQLHSHVTISQCKFRQQVGTVTSVYARHID